MRMSDRFLPLCAALLLAASPHAGAQPPQAAVSKAESAMLESMMLGDFSRVEYRDAEGTAIGFEQFVESVKASKSFSIEKESDHSLAVLRIKDPDRTVVPVEEGIVAGSRLPALGKLETLDGDAVSDADLRDRYTLLSFYFAECVPCIAEIPALNGYAAAHPEIGVWAITFDDTATSKAFVAQRGLELPVIAEAQVFIDAVGVTGYPTWLLVDADGRIAAVHTGGSTGGDAAGITDIDAWVQDAMSM